MLTNIEQNNSAKLKSSFRDPAGFLFYNQGNLLRQINPCYRSNYKKLMQSGLYNELCSAGLLIPHQEISNSEDEQQGLIIIQPTKVPFISYPYEWSFSQLKQAALLTLKIQKIALKYNMSLKDASSYNVTFYKSKPIFIDTLSFEEFDNKPWVAYRQFCQHFYSPLLLMAFTDIRLNQLLRNYIDGIPLDLTKKLLPFATKFKLGPLLHIFLHAKAQQKYQSDFSKKTANSNFDINKAKLFTDSLINATKKINWKVEKSSEWYDYYQANNNYTESSISEKETVVNKWLSLIKPETTWDLGANTGKFSSIAAKHSKQVIAWDIDTSCVEMFFRHKSRPENVLPLFLDLTNPSPNIGWNNQERENLIQRGPANAILALGLIHHLAIANNVSLVSLADFFASLCQDLIVEFVPKHDSQTKKLLANRQDIFENYTKDNFEKIFSRQFTCMHQTDIKDSVRTLYWFRKKA